MAKKQQLTKRNRKNMTVKEFELENYEPKGELEGFPKEIIARMLDCQEEQGNKSDVTVFENNLNANQDMGGFSWARTYEKFCFWNHIINHKDFDFFFKRYPKICSKCHKKENNITIFSDTTRTQPCINFNIPKDKNQDFKLGDKVYDIMHKSAGIITNVNIGETEYPLVVKLEYGKSSTYTIDGRVNSYYKTPQLLHYRDDYDYTTINFNNLPKRQEPKRWRAEKGECYYFIKRDEYDFNLDEIYRSMDYYNYFSNDQYKIGNYFETKEEAQEVADELKEYFKLLIKEEHEQE